MLKSTIVIAFETMLKNYVSNRKKMSFLKISDPAKRDLLVKEYLETKKNIRDNLLSERTGEQQLQTDLSKFFKPITETQKATTREITEGLKPIKKGIDNLPQAITFPAYPSIQAADKETATDKEMAVAPYFIGDIAESYLRKFTTRFEADKTYGLYDRDGNFYIGNKPAIIRDNNIIADDKEYEVTPSLWELIVSKYPDDNIYSNDDHGNYARLMLRTNTLHRINNPNSDYPKVVRDKNGIGYTKPFGIIGKSMKEEGLLLFRVTLTRC